jgi:hypothetical protein
MWALNGEWAAHKSRWPMTTRLLTAALRWVSTRICRCAVGVARAEGGRPVVFALVVVRPLHMGRPGAKVEEWGSAKGSGMAVRVNVAEDDAASSDDHVRFNDGRVLAAPRGVGEGMIKRLELGGCS